MANSSDLYQALLDKLTARIQSLQTSDEMSDEIQDAMQLIDMIRQGYQFSEIDLQNLPQTIRDEVDTEITTALQALPFFSDSSDWMGNHLNILNGGDTTSILDAPFVLFNGGSVAQYVHFCTLCSSTNYSASSVKLLVNVSGVFFELHASCVGGTLNHSASCNVVGLDGFTFSNFEFKTNTYSVGNSKYLSVYLGKASFRNGFIKKISEYRRNGTGYVTVDGSMKTDDDNLNNAISVTKRIIT